MELIRETTNGTIWPYSLSQLRTDEPQLSISLSPHDGELAAMAALDPPVLVSRVEEVAPPAVDPRIKRIEKAHPVKADGNWLQQWTVRDATPEEIAAYDEVNAPRPDYQGFYNALLVSACYQAVLQQIMAAPTPGPSTALTVFVSAMQDCLAGRANVPAMQASINLLLGQVALSEQHQVELQQLLDDAHLGSLYSLPPQESPPGDG